MIDLLIGTLKKLGYPVRRQGSIAESEQRPDHFFTFWNDDTDSEGFYDNEETKIRWEYSVNFYSTDPLKVNKTLLEAKKMLQKEGFIVSGAGYDVASGEPTQTGRGISVCYCQNIK